MEKNNKNTSTTIEESFERLDEIIAKMQSDNLSLEDTFALYKEGISVVEGCNNIIEKIQCDITRLSTAEE